MATFWRSSVAVSYTHLDVYKRQEFTCVKNDAVKRFNEFVVREATIDDSPAQKRVLARLEGIERVRDRRRLHFSLTLNRSRMPSWRSPATTSPVNSAKGTPSACARTMTFAILGAISSAMRPPTELRTSRAWTSLA